jgi:hypothetical protein
MRTQWLTQQLYEQAKQRQSELLAQAEANRLSRLLGQPPAEPFRLLARLRQALNRAGLAWRLNPQLPA